MIAFAAGASGSCTINGVGAQACGAITRPSQGRTEVTYWSGYASDTITADRLTISAGLRYDDQKGTALAASVPANPQLSDDPAGRERGPERRRALAGCFTPLRRDLRDRRPRRTLARMSYARYANQLNAYPNSSLSAIPGIAYAYYPWTDTNKNNIIDPGELNTTGLPLRTDQLQSGEPLVSGFGQQHQPGHEVPEDRRVRRRPRPRDLRQLRGGRRLHLSPREGLLLLLPGSGWRGQPHSARVPARPHRLRRSPQRTVLQRPSTPSWAGGRRPSPPRASTSPTAPTTRRTSTASS